MNHRGFTLIETMVYLGLFGILMAGLIVSALYLIDSGTQNQRLIAIQEEGTFINRKLAWAIGSASDADTSGGTTLTLTRPDLPANENPLTITLDNGSMTLKRGSGDALPLNSSEYKVDSVVFKVVHETGRPTYVAVDFEIEGEPFQLDTYLRE